MHYTQFNNDTLDNNLSEIMGKTKFPVIRFGYLGQIESNTNLEYYRFSEPNCFRQKGYFEADRIESHDYR
jgi:hypothetical protein